MSISLRDNPAWFPPQTRSYILSFQFSHWYPLFLKHTIKSTIIRPVPAGFQEYLTSDGIFVPEGAEDKSVLSYVLPIGIFTNHICYYNPVLVHRIAASPMTQTVG